MSIDIDPSNYAMAHRAGRGFALIPKSAAAGQKHYTDNRITFGAIPCDHEGTPRKGAAPFLARFRADIPAPANWGTDGRVVGNA